MYGFFKICTQLQNAITHLNEAVNLIFIPGKEFPFDKGGIPCTSNYNPVQNYNNSKLEKKELTTLFFQMQLVVINSHTTSTCIREIMKQYFDSS